MMMSHLQESIQLADVPTQVGVSPKDHMISSLMMTKMTRPNHKIYGVWNTRGICLKGKK